ncbi:hypothetical protein ACLOJK_033891 [Asimina triloba]
MEISVRPHWQNPIPTSKSRFCSCAVCRLEGKVAIITGGAGGIGEATARLFLAHGAKVVIADVQDQLGQAICKHLDQDRISYFHCDVTDEDEVRNLVDFAIQKHGKLDIMYNNAGTVDPKSTSILTIEKSSIQRVVNVNLVGAMLGAKHAARAMVQARNAGSILFTASAAASTAIWPEHGYVVSKWGVVGLTKNLAMELGQFGIRVNCISPYIVATRITQGIIPNSDDPRVSEKLASDAANLKGVTLKADDIAQAALYLASDESRYVSSLNLVVDGGFSVTNPSLAMVLRNQF